VCGSDSDHCSSIGRIRAVESGRNRRCSYAQAEPGSWFAAGHWQSRAVTQQHWQTDLRILLGGRHPRPSRQAPVTLSDEMSGIERWTNPQYMTMSCQCCCYCKLASVPCEHGIDCAALACLLLSPALLRQCRWGGEQVREIFGQHRPFLFAQLQKLIRQARAREAPHSLSIRSGFPRTGCPSWPFSPPVRGAVALYRASATVTRRKEMLGRRYCWGSDSSEHIIVRGGECMTARLLRGSGHKRCGI
jgi:hypothetical protein